LGQSQDWPFCFSGAGLKKVPNKVPNKKHIKVFELFDPSRIRQIHKNTVYPRILLFAALETLLG
jgi:hypothetical protein